MPATEVSWLPSYAPRCAPGTLPIATCGCQAAPIDSPLVSRPDVLLALNEPSLRKFLPASVPGGLVLYNSDQLPRIARRPGCPAQ